MKVIDIKNWKYPYLLKQIDEPPLKLYHKGVWDGDIFNNCLAVVGSRRMTTYGRAVTDKIVMDVARAGVTIVSGFMYGVDAQAHRAALAAGGRTIAVMPCGIDLIHPSHQKDLYQEIIERGGLIISELENDYPPMVWTYPKRNRIVAGLSQAGLIVEAGLGSGSLITANFLKKFGRRIYAVPGPLTSSQSQGTIQLIKDGANMAVQAEDILEFYGLVKERLQDKGIPRAGLNVVESKIVEKLAQEPKDIDSLSRAISIPVSKLSVAISLLQLQGIVDQEGNKYYVNFARNDSQ